ncbi:MAG TPA: AIM24 family protein [Acidimicrobiales bacterium]|nr:AIM24 family protein [Acidimicrobiales bacterium]
MSASGTTYVCRFCRMATDPAQPACAHCGAPVDVRAVVSDSGWQEQPPIRDMARIIFGQSRCQIEGKYVPVADFDLRGAETVYFSHHSVLWSDPSVTMAPMPLAGGWNRVRAGLPLVMLQASGPGHIALSEDAPGEIIALPLQAGQAVVVREHRFLAATEAVRYTWQQAPVWYTTGTGNEQQTHYPMGYNVDWFTADGRPGLLLLHAPGNTFIRDLAPGTSILVQPTSLLYCDPSVDVNLHLEYPNQAGMYWSSNFSYRHIWLRLTGPGRVAVQSVFEREAEAEPITSSSWATVAQW